MFHFPRRWLAALFVMTSASFGFARAHAEEESHAAVNDQPGQEQQRKSYFDILQRKSRFRILVNPGTDQLAVEYYQRIGAKLGVTLIEEIPPKPSAHKATDLDGLLAYLGYGKSPISGILAKDLERLDSFLLMPRTDTEFMALDAATSGRVSQHLTLSDFWDDTSNRPKVLVSRFFAPKIATYYDPTDPFIPIDRDAIIPGWRKLVRLPARAGSAAAAANLKHAYILFNVKEKDPDKNPFENLSQNNQVILVPQSFDPKTEDACYFAVYQGQDAGYQLGRFLVADFDLPGHAATQGAGGGVDSKYYVPTSCAACHGHGPEIGNPVNGVFKYAKPNYLDTDQWYDWADFDFRGVSSSLNDVVFDGGKDHASVEFQRAFDVVAALNTDIKDETFRAERIAGTETFQTLAPKKWLQLHQVTSSSPAAGDRARKPYSARSLSSAPADGWNPGNLDEMRLLKLLDNHCFRCHSSVIYNVFDKAAVRDRAAEISIYLNLPLHDPAGNRLPGFFMPQGRVLEERERHEILRLVEKLFIGPKELALKSDVVTLSIVAKNYAFTAQSTENPTFRVAQGATIKVSLTSGAGTHDWVLADGATGQVLARTERVSGSTPETVEFAADRAGNHVYYCSVGQHRALGMEGRFVVESR
ncbi:MAG: hypothetical protein WD845_07315 [Pirellulales bacterium]